MLKFLDSIAIEWKSIFRSTKKGFMIAYIVSYFLAGTLFFIYMLFHDPSDTNSESMGLFTLFLIYWAGLLLVAFLFPIVGMATAVVCALMITPFFLPFFFLWLGTRSKSKTSSITFCILSGSTFGLLCAIGFYYILAQG